MKNFEMMMPESVDQALELLPTRPSWAGVDTVILAGGQDLVPEMKEHLVEPDRVVNLKSTGELRGHSIRADGAASIGALVTLAELARDPAFQVRYPVLTEAAGSVGSAQIRSQATVGGNLCQRPRCWYYRDENTVCLKKGGTECFSYAGMNKYNAVLGGGPSYIVHPSDLAPALISLDAMVRVRGPEGERQVALQDFYVLPSEADDVTRETVLAPGDIVTDIEVPAHSATWRSTYLKFQEKGSFDFALGAVAVAVRLDGNAIAEARVCLGGVAPVPWRCRTTEQLLLGRTIDDETCRLAADDALRGAEPLDHNAYKIPLTKGLLTRALKSLAEA